MNLLKKPLASSVAVMCRSSSCLVMWPTIPTCALVARSGLFFFALGRRCAPVPLAPQVVIERADQRPLHRHDPRPLVLHAGAVDVRARDDMQMRAGIGAAKRAR
jgi:hypothetical protein